MNSKSKDMVILVFVILTVLCLAIAVGANKRANKFRVSFEREMGFRLDLEERVSKLRIKEVKLANVLKERNLALKEDKELIEELNKDISEKQAKLKELQSDLHKEILLKDKLEDNLKEELAR